MTTMTKHDLRSLALFLLCLAAYCVVSTMDYHSEVERLETQVNEQ